MKITINREDNFITVDGRGFAIDVNDLDEDIRVIHFDDTSAKEHKGNIEHTEESNKGNFWLDDFTPFQRFLDRWIAVRDAIPPPPQPTPAQLKLLQEYGFVQEDNAIVAFLQMSPAQIEAYIDTNVTGANLASVNQIKIILKVLAKVVAVSTRAAISKQ